MRKDERRLGCIGSQIRSEGVDGDSCFRVNKFEVVARFIPIDALLLMKKSMPEMVKPLVLVIRRVSAQGL